VTAVTTDAGPIETGEVGGPPMEDTPGGRRLQAVAQSLFGPGMGSYGTGADDADNRRARLMGRSVGLIWLVFLIEPLSAALGDDRTLGGHKVLVVAVCVLFVIAFAALSLLSDGLRARLPRSVLAGVVVSMWILTIFLVAYDRPVWDYEFIFSVFPAMRLTSHRALTVGGVAALAVVVGATAHLDSGDIFFVAVIICAAGISMVGVVRLVDANLALHAAQADRARIAVAEERLRFARDLHDLLGHSLSVITLKSEVAGKVLAADPVRAGVELDEIQVLARRALREVREAVSGYRMATLAVELAGARSALSAAGVTWDEDLTSTELPGEVESALAWSLREGVTNLIRHARATTCTLCLMVDGESATMTVTDDGVGHDGASAPGNGLRGLGERLVAVGGRLEVGPDPGGGYRLRASVPLTLRPSAAMTGGDR
jgi:two-component system sensor histidine kinase DesK